MMTIILITPVRLLFVENKIAIQISF